MDILSPSEEHRLPTQNESMVVRHPLVFFFALVYLISCRSSSLRGSRKSLGSPFQDSLGPP
jgi:hypothetical protein